MKHNKPGMEAGADRKYIMFFGPELVFTKPISSFPFFSKFLNVAKAHVSYWISRLYLTDIAAAPLQRHLWNMKVI